jgi:hypothetical protein
VWSLSSYQNTQYSSDCGFQGCDCVLPCSGGHQQAASMFRSRVRRQVEHVCVSTNGKAVMDWLCYASDMFLKWPHGQARLMDLLTA